MIHPADFQRAVEDKLEERYNSIVTAMVDGNADDFADYKYRCGQIFEIRQLGEIIKEVARSIYTQPPDQPT